MMRQGLPDPADVLGMEPEELAPFVLRYLNSNQSSGDLNRYNFTLGNDDDLTQRLGHTKYAEYLRCLAEAWSWLEREGLLAPKPGDPGEWAFITRKGLRALELEDFSKYVPSSMFPTYLDVQLLTHVQPLFVRGQFDTAIFQAFKEVEVRVRKKAELTDSDYGIELMKKAFGPTGKLTDKSVPTAEQDRLRDLFTGAIGTFKNPSSHREVRYNDPREVIDVICLANQLLRIIDRA